LAEKITITLVTADRAKKAQVSLPDNTTVGTLIESCKKNWALPQTEDYAIRNPQKNVQLKTQDSLAAAGISNGTELEIYPLLEAGVL
jgi:uncharacterized ubiquitin-like protein YukD